MRKILPLILIVIALASSCGHESERHLVQKIDDLGDCRIGVLSSTPHDRYVAEHFPKAEIVSLNSLAAMSYALSSGKCDALFTLRQNFDYLKEGNDDFCMIDSVFAVDTMVAAFRFNETELQIQFNRFLEEIRQDGTYATMLQNWFADDGERQMPQTDTVCQSEPLLVGLNGVLSCFTIMTEDQLAGFEPELMCRFAQSLGRPAELTTVAFNSLEPYLNRGKCDVVVSTLAATPERAKSVLFSDSYFESDVVCVIMNDVKKAKMTLAESIRNDIDINLLTEKRYMLLVQGFFTTISISFFAIIFGMIIGAMVCMLTLYCGRIGHVVGELYVQIVLSIPILVLLMILFYVVFSESRLSAVNIACITFAINFSAYFSNMLCSAIRSIGKGQTEASAALGFGKMQTLLYVIAPQAMKRILPIFKATAVSLVKNTSVVGYIAILDLTKAADIIRSRSFDEFFPLILISAIYLLIAWMLSFLLDRIKFK